jgi:type II secretory pathway component PulC
MGRSLVRGLSATVVGLSLIGGHGALAEEAAPEQSTLMVRAWGKTGGAVEQLGRSERQPEEQPLPRDLPAGVLRRAALRAELALGISRFLRQVHVEAVTANGNFVGWRVLTLFPKRPDVRVQILRVGDTVLRVNGKSIERPEAFKEVWDSLNDATELTLEIDRAGHQSTLHFPITQ